MAQRDTVFKRDVVAPIQPQAPMVSTARSTKEDARENDLGFLGACVPVRRARVVGVWRRRWRDRRYRSNGWSWRLRGLGRFGGFERLCGFERFCGFRWLARRGPELR